MSKTRVFLKIIAGAAAGCVLAAALTLAVNSDENEENAASAYAYCLYCANNAQVVAAKNENVRLPPASTTKIMTAILGIEAIQAADDMQIEITEDMYAEGSSMYLNSGEIVRLSDLVGGMMMVSGNDAANAIAKTLGGNSEGFADMMNEKAGSLGLFDTHFVTPSGLDADGHFTTAFDLARLMAHCMENDAFRQIVSGSSVTVDFVEPQGKSQTYYNENKLLSRYEYCVGGKTGYTDKAGRTLVSCAEKDGVRLICVTLNDPNDWNDHAELFDYGFDKMNMSQANAGSAAVEISVVGGESESVTANVGEPPLVCQGSGDVQVKYEIPPFLYAPVKNGQQIGVLKYYTGGVYAGKTDISAASDVELSERETSFIENIISFFR